MDGKYILEGREVCAVYSIEEWAKYFESANRHVADDTIGGARVSTVFLGIDHQYGDSPPLIFETMIFGGNNDQEQWRYSTYDEAEAGHKAAIALVRSSLT